MNRQRLSDYRLWRFRPGWNRARVVAAFLDGRSIEALSSAAVVPMVGASIAARFAIEQVIRDSAREAQR